MILSIGKIIYFLLTNNKELSNMVKKQIYPLIADSDTQFPFIVYKRTNINNLESKDRLIGKQSANIELLVATDKYNESILVADKVIECLNNKRGSINGFNVSSIDLIDADEDYIENCYIQKLIFKIDIK